MICLMEDVDVTPFDKLKLLIYVQGKEEELHQCSGGSSKASPRARACSGGRSYSRSKPAN